MLHDPPFSRFHRSVLYSFSVQSPVAPSLFCLVSWHPTLCRLYSMAPPLQDPHPEVELAPPPRALPLVEPRLITPSPVPFDEELSTSPSFLSNPGARRKASVSTQLSRAKRESYDLSGSTFLITDTGKTLKLPVPSDSKTDPLNWSRWKTAGAIFSVALYSVVSLTASQAASVVLEGITMDFEHEVIKSPDFRVNVTNNCSIEDKAMATESPRNRSYLVHGPWVLPVGATVYWHGQTTHHTNCNHCRASCCDLGRRSSNLQPDGRGSVFPWSQ